MSARPRPAAAAVRCRCARCGGLAGLVLALASGMAGAQAACGGFQMSDSRRAAAFCDELNHLLVQPHEGAIGERSSPDREPELERILQDNPLLFEAYRSRPEETLDLIRRIREAGGLSR